MDKATAISAAVLLISPAGVLALVNFAKKLGLTGSWALLLAPVLGIALNVTAFYSGIAYVGAPLFAVVAIGAIAGLTASGLWDVSSQTTTIHVHNYSSDGLTRSLQKVPESTRAAGATVRSASTTASKAIKSKKPAED